jgi:hypothetical protein
LNAPTGTDQSIDANTFTNNDLFNLNLDNASRTITNSGQLNIYGTLSFGMPISPFPNYNGGGDKEFKTNNLLTLKSIASGTANVADLTNGGGTNIGNTINGQATVERYLRIGTGADHHPKSWQFLATPTVGQTVLESWMENKTTPTGYGTTITSPFGNGFDPATPNLYPSMKYYRPGTNFDPSSPDWKGISGTDIPIFSENGYMLFVRGDRSVTSYTQGANSTTLRTKGTLLTYGQTVPTGTYDFTSVGNPYASPIDMRNVTFTNTDDDFYTVWVSYLGGNYGYGAYVTYTRLGGPNSDFESTSGQVNNDIQSGEAFFVQSTLGAGSLTFNETTKADNSVNSNVVFRGNSTKEAVQLLRANLYYVNADGSTFPGDGTVVQFGDNYSNKVDTKDGRKFFNSGINLWIKKDSESLVVERRPLPEKQDTIFMSLTGARVQAYRFVFVAEGLQESGRQAYLEDHYLNTVTPLNMSDSTVIDFKIENNNGSKAGNRFDIVFKKIIVVPPAFISVEGHAIDHDIRVDWKVAHEKNVEQYEVETSTDGKQFIKAATVPAANSDNHSYNWLDKNLLPGYYYYRVKMVAKDGKVQYGNTVRVLIGNGKSAISIYPNPITDGVISLHFINQPAGKYAIRLMNQLGQVIVSKQIERMNGSNTESIKWDYNLAHGIYQLEILCPDGSVKVIKVIY